VFVQLLLLVQLTVAWEWRQAHSLMMPEQQLQGLQFVAWQHQFHVPEQQ
jgi:hypothetical protein